MGRQQPLCDADCVLCGAASGVGYFEVLLEVVVDGQMLGLGEYGVVHFDAVLVEEGLRDVGADVQQRVADAEQHAVERRHDAVRGEGEGVAVAVDS